MFYTGSPPLRVIIVKEGFVWSSVSAFISCQFRYLHILNHETPAYLIKNSLITIPLPKKGGKHNQPTNIGNKNKNSEDGLVERSRVFLTVADADTLFGSWDRFAESWVTNFHFRRAEASPTIFERDDLPRRLRVQ